MARAKKTKEREPDDKDDEGDDEEGLAARDDAMARLGGALASLKVAEDSVTTALALFVNPDEDDEGEEREEAMNEALEAAGAASRGIEAALKAFEDADVEAGEPWEED